MSELTFTDEKFNDEVLAAKEVVLVDFWAPWCGPCKMQAPIIEEVAKDFTGQPVKIGKLNVDDNPDIAGRFQIMSIPTLIIFKNGKPVDQMLGVQDKNILKEKISKFI